MFSRSPPRAEAPSITLTRTVPRIKVIRLVNHILHAHPEWAVERLHIDARSGCSDFVGTVIVEGAGESRIFEFAWDCRWRAEEQGWLDAYGFPDQIRAADEFGWNCFQRWAEHAPSSADTLAAQHASAVHVQNLSRDVTREL